ALVKPLVRGDVVRDWSTEPNEAAAFVPVEEDHATFLALDPQSSWFKRLWRTKTPLRHIRGFDGRPRYLNGTPWWHWYRWVPSKYQSKFLITFAEVATHNHFVLDRGGKVFKQTAPVIKLPEGATEADHLALI